MSDKMSFLLFGDQSTETHAFLADFCRLGDPSLLARSFLEQVATALREEVDQCSALDRARIPTFSSIKELNERYHGSPTKNSAVDSALLSITQLVHYIEYAVRNLALLSLLTCTPSRAEKKPEDTTNPRETSAVGLSNGLFAATAVATAPSISALVEIGVQMVLMAFRTGLHVAALADRLYGPYGVSESWTYVIPGASEKSIRSFIGDFHESNVG